MLRHLIAQATASSAVVILTAVSVAYYQPVIRPFTAAHTSRAAQADDAPAVLPALQNWQAGSGSGYSWAAGGRIVVNTADAGALQNDAKTFAADLGDDLNTSPPPVVTGTKDGAKPGDIFLALDSTDTQLGNEGYALTAAPVLSVSARNAAGAWWGTRTILQLLRQAQTIPAGTATDWPKYPVRAAYVDTGNTAFPMDWWHNEIRELSYLKMDRLTVAANWIGLSADDEKQLDSFAATYHVTLAGEVNTPGHMDPYLPDEDTLRNAAGDPMQGALDLSNPDAVTWAKQQVTDFMGNFANSSQWSLGGDEYPRFNARADDTTNFPALNDYAQKNWGDGAIPEDVYRDYANQIDDLAHQNNKSMVMWNDDLFPSDKVQLNKDITIMYWFLPGTASLTPADMAANGNQLVNVDQDHLYYNEGASNGPNATPNDIWENFDPGTFNGGNTLPGGADDPHLSGIMITQWASNNEAPGDLENDFMGLNRATAQKAWGSSPANPTWDQMQDIVNAIGRAPGFVSQSSAASHKAHCRSTCSRIPEMRSH